jgi:hypothetical protein
MPRAYSTILKELRQSKRKVDSLQGELESEKARRLALYIELTELLEQLRVEFGVDEPLTAPVSRHGELNRRTPECNLMISVGKTVFRCRQAKLTVEAARQVAIMEVSNLAIEKYGLASLPKVVLDQLEVSLESAYFCGDWPSGDYLSPGNAKELQ